MFVPCAARPGRRYIVLLTALLSAGPVPAGAAEPLTLARAEALALARDAGLEDLAARREALAETAVAEAQLPDPELLLGASNVPVDSFELDREPMTQLVLGVRQRFPSGDTLDLSRARLETLAGATARAQEERRRQVVRALREAWIEAAWHAEAARLVAAEAAWYAQLEDAVAAAYASGRRRQDELIRIGLERDALAEEEIRHLEARTTFIAEIGRLLGADADRAPAGTLPRLPPLPPREDSAARLDGHPSLAVRAGEADARGIAVDLARQRYKPSWMLDFRYGFRDGRDAAGDDRADMLTAMLSFDLPLFAGQRQDRQVAAARASERSARRQLEDERRRLAALADGAWERHARLGERLVIYDTRIVPGAEDYVEATLAAYQNGQAPFDELVRAEKTLLDARLKRLRLAADRLSVTAGLAYLIGDTP